MLQTQAARNLGLWALAGLALAWAACEGGADQRGALGEFCTSDADCRPSLICEQNLCLSDLGDNSGEPPNNSNPQNNGADNNGSNNGASNNASNNGSNNEPMPEDACARACARLVGCDFTEDEPACARECADAAALGPARAWEQVFACVEGSACEALAGCFPDDENIPRDRLQTCQDFAQLAGLCEGNEELTLQLCALLALTDDDLQFSRVERCSAFASCPAVLGCLEDWAELERGALARP